MALFDLSKVAKKVQKSAEDLAKTVTETAGKVSEVKQEDVATAAKKARTSASTVKKKRPDLKRIDVFSFLDQSEDQFEKSNPQA